MVSVSYLSKPQLRLLRIMDNTGSSSFLRNRRLESFFSTSSVPSLQLKPQVLVKEAVRRLKTDNYLEDDGWVSTVISCIRIVACFVTMMITTLIWALIMLVLLPWPCERIRQGNVYGHVTGRLLVNNLSISLAHVNLASA